MAYVNVTPAPSKPNSLNTEDFNKALQNSLVFLVPLLLVVIPSLITIIPATWKYGAITLYVLNFLMDLAKKYKN